MDFNEYYWHDAVIENIQIDRTNPGLNDTIQLEIEWPENGNKSNIIFENVYWASLNLNFGFVCTETILHAEMVNGQDVDIDRFYSKWKGAMDEVKLFAYIIELNSTGGSMKILAEKFREDCVY